MTITMLNLDDIKVALQQAISDKDYTSFSKSGVEIKGGDHCDGVRLWNIKILPDQSIDKDSVRELQEIVTSIGYNDRLTITVPEDYADLEEGLAELGFEHWVDSPSDDDHYGYWWPTDTPMLAV